MISRRIPRSRAALLFVTAMLCGTGLLSTNVGAQTNAATAKDTVKPGDDWAQIASVLQHPRCANCHPVGDRPKQTELRKFHKQMVMRGAQGKGTPALPCSACHQDRNMADGKVPGAPHWHLAPASMGWEGLSSPALCNALKDRTKNGERDLPALAKHMIEDALVQWAWNPGTREKPPLSQAAFHETVTRWANAGGPCP